MTKIKMLVIAMAAATATAPAIAQQRSEAERQAAYDRGFAADQAAIAQSRQQQLAAHDRAIAAAKTANFVMSGAAARVPYGAAAYKAGKAAGDALYSAVKRRGK